MQDCRGLSLGEHLQPNLCRDPIWIGIGFSRPDAAPRGGGGDDGDDAVDGDDAPGPVPVPEWGRQRKERQPLRQPYTWTL